ncbi:gamma-glutamyl hydrolase A-like isoform X1 [Biomphalaria pfeifferi]|uniref:folate gamma-glutamyl hydrolase n=1 Tax=Biomphalaria pfeifferi TaxID=112525 RepID=A0AAD8B7B7_BIOPF|nr:gamma-glutamyl hydrolase A-like isoform X1 [Biomphalaria pfeifferi]
MSHYSKVLSCFIIFCFGLLQTSTSLNLRPIIGIITQPTHAHNSVYGEEYIQASYVKYLEMAGARVVAIKGNQSQEYYEDLFKKINGVFFPGGETDIDKGIYATSGKYMYDLAIEANKNLDFFPLWGTCLGFQLMTALSSDGNDHLKRTDSNNLTLPLIFENDFQTSRLFKDMPADLIEILKTEPVTQNEHNWSLLLKDFFTLPNLSTFYRLLTTNVGRDNVTFVSGFEANQYPFYGIQWHPEKSVVTWDYQVVNHSFNAIRVSQYFANFFVNEARKSNHRFNSIEDEAEAIIENAKRVFVPDFKSPEAFYFNSAINILPCGQRILLSIVSITCLVFIIIR